jgi:hypothetical protein
MVGVLNVMVNNSTEPSFFTHKLKIGVVQSCGHLFSLKNLSPTFQMQWCSLKDISIPK